MRKKEKVIVSISIDIYLYNYMEELFDNNS